MQTGSFVKAALFALGLLLAAYTDARGACTVSTTAMNFGAYDILSVSATDSAGSITVSCDEAPPPIVTLAIGASPNSGTANPRQMRGIAFGDLLSYNLYTDSTRTTVWGDGGGGTQTLSNRVPRGRPWNATVYGRIPPEQDISAGAYSETLTVTITW